MILDLAREFGEDRKADLARELKRFRFQVKREVTGRLERSIEKTKEMYHET